MEFDIEIAPYQKLQTKNEMIIVDIQPALAANGHPISCNKTLEHKMHRLYLPKQDFTLETYFEAITSMLTVQDIQNGTEVSYDASHLANIISILSNFSMSV